MSSDAAIVALGRGPIGIVVLAAGESARMGEPKQLLNYGGNALVRHAALTALSQIGSPVTIVLGARASEIRPQVEDLPVIITVADDWQAGMGSSLRAGMRAQLAGQPDLGAAIFLVCDQPLVSTSTLDQLIESYRRAEHSIVASEYGGTLGVPALFHRSHFPQLLALEGPAGARQIIHEHRERAAAIPFPLGVVDLDTPDDYARLARFSPDLEPPTTP